MRSGRSASRRPRARHRAREDPARAHEGVDAAQVAARALRARIVGREVVERLGLEDARQHGSGSTHCDAQQRAVAAEAGAERRQPPPAGGRVVGERGLEHEVDEGARQVAVLAQHRRAVAERVGVELEAALEGEQHVAAAGMQDPGGDVAAVQAAARRAPSPARDARSRRRASAPRASGCCAACRPSARTSAPCAAPARAARRRPAIRPRRRAGPARRDSTAAPAPSPNRQALISTPGSLSRYIAALLTSTQTDSTCVAAPARAASGRAAGSAAPRRSPGRRGRTPARRRAGRAARRRSPRGRGRGSRCRC